VKVGRSPFDEATRRAIERHNPGVTFDWPRLVAAPVPPPPADVERWRERRRQERAEKAARAALHADEAIDPEIASEPDSMQPDSPEPDGAEPVRDERDLGGAAANQVEPSNENVALAQPGHVGRRRRRRRRRHGRSERPGPTNEARPADEPAKPSESSE
jgi:hypothetical protein